MPIKQQKEIRFEPGVMSEQAEYAIRLVHGLSDVVGKMSDDLKKNAAKEKDLLDYVDKLGKASDHHSDAIILAEKVDAIKSGILLVCQKLDSLGLAQDDFEEVVLGVLK